MRQERAVATQLMIQYALGGVGNDMDPASMRDWLEGEGISDELTDVQLAIFTRPLKKEQTNALSWRTEAVAMLCWIGGVLDDLVAPPVDLSYWDTFFPKIPPEVSTGRFYEAFGLRPREEVLDALDLYYVANWSIRHEELWDADTYPGARAVVVVEERRTALEWVLDPNTDWDEITLDT